ncbi:MAG TPA: hypothetical protein VF881_18525 [Polyangiaceae bacterium]
MANQVVVPFSASRTKRGAKHELAADVWRRPARSERSTPMSRLSMAREMVRALFETLSYLREPRVRPPLPALPPARGIR